MSFSDHDPWNHLDIRIISEGQEAYIECDSCGWDSKRHCGAAGSILTPVSHLVSIWHEHLAKSHKHTVPKEQCRHTFGYPAGGTIRCVLEKNHMTKHAFEWEE